MSDGHVGKTGDGGVSQWLRSLADALDSKRGFEVIWKWGRLLTLVLTVLYGILLFVLWLAMHWIGERNITAAFCLYLPPLVWLLPFLLLIPLGTLFHQRCLIAQIVFVFFAVFVWLGFKWESAKPQTVAQDGCLKVMTYNRGQNMNQSLRPFKNANHPDVMVFQDAGARADNFLRSPDYAEFGHGVSVGEFTLLSRFPIKANSLLVDALLKRPARAARFVIDWNGQLVSIYAVHLMTPREVLRGYMRGAFLWGVLGLPGTPWAKKREYYQAFWDGQIADVKIILDAVRSDSNPCIVAGDFNAPHLGYLHRMLTQELIDTHAAAGHGFGFTFPGVTHNPLSLKEPWMRIDYIFCDHRWTALECVTERDRPSQHRALVTNLQLVKTFP